ncbi:MAG: metallophosphoesterase [Azoarcus sp.]|jgi:predicted MPP superfamily phosphohydrolase|nr:metallophosphoesterase [Azoarcus sp.]
MQIFVLIKWLYFLVNVWLVYKLYDALRAPEVSRGFRFGACALAVLLSLSYPVSRLIESNDFWVRALAFAGTFWLSLVLHAVLAWWALIVFRWLNRRCGWFEFAPERAAHWRLLACGGITAAALVASTAGLVNSQFPTVRALTLAAPADAAPLRIVAVSDSHLGRLSSPAYFDKVVDLIVPLQPDLVVFAGDVLEYDFDPADAPALAAAIRRLTPRLGVWGVYGNHEYIGGRIELNKQLLKEIGIRILVDEWAELENAPGKNLLLIGRDDLSGKWFGRERKSLAEILADAPAGEHLKILLDHQPFDLPEAEAAGVYLQVSGHTHRGQIAPFNLLVWLIYENSYGLSTRGDSHFLVSSGVGTWGPSVRTTGRPEVVLIDLVPQK